VVLAGPVTCLLDGRLGFNSCKAFRFWACLARVVRQELQVANTLPDLVVEKLDITSFRAHPEQYFESISNA
jgi:hypothetical protein